MRTYALQLMCSIRVIGSLSLATPAVITMWKFFRSTLNSLVSFGWLMVPSSTSQVYRSSFRSFSGSLSLYKNPEGPKQSIGGVWAFVYLLIWMMVQVRILIFMKPRGFQIWYDMMCSVVVSRQTMRKANGCQSSWEFLGFV